MFIVFEGIDGSGKSTQSNLLAETLAREGYSVVHTRPEKNDDVLTVATSELMTAIKGITHDVTHAETMGPETELFLYLAQVAQLAHQVIAPALKENKIVISDRYTYSLLAYFHYGKGIARETVEPLLSYATQGLEPDLIVYTDIPAEDAFLRKEKSGKVLGRKELQGPVFFEQVRQGFLSLSQEHPEKWLVVNTDSNSIPVLQTTVLGRVKSLLT